MAVKNVAIIGCGVSGLISIKCCLDAGLNPVCFEQQSWLGGLWNYTNETRPNLASVHERTVTNISKLMTGFSDFPIPKEFPNYMPQHLVQQYIEMFAKHFDLEKYVQFGTEVVKLERSADHGDTGKWLVFIRKLDGVNSEIITKSFDAVMICNGHFWDQVKPHTPGIEKFEGVQLHSGDYRSFHPYVGKRVLIVGCSHSAGDIGVELSHHAAQVYISTRSGCYIFTRLGHRGLPSDLYISRASSLIPNSINLRLAPGLLNNKYDFKTFGLEPTGTFQQKVPFVNDELLQRIITGSIVVKGAIKEIAEHSVTFEGGETLDDIDVLVFATGFKPNYPFAKEIIEVKDNYYTSLHKHMFLPDAAWHTLAVIGAVGVGGSAFPVSEMQARVAAEVFAGRCFLPSRDVMEKEIAEREHKLLKTGTSKHNLMRVSYITYMDELGEMIGAKPNLWSILKQDPKLAYQCFFGSAVSSQYRLQGPNSWKGARKHIMTLREQCVYPLSTRKCAPLTEGNKCGVLAFIVVMAVAVIAVILIS